MVTCYNLFTWKTKVPTENKCIYKQCILEATMANYKVGDKIDTIVQDYENSIFVIKTSEGTDHVPYRIVCDGIYPKYEGITQQLIEKVRSLERRIGSMS